MIDTNVKLRYNQHIETIDSLKKTIIPFLKSSISAEYDLSGIKEIKTLVDPIAEPPVLKT